MAVQLGGVTDGQCFGDRQVAWIHRFPRPSRANEQALAVGGVRRQAHRLGQVRLGPREDRVDHSSVVGGHREPRVLGQRRLEHSERPRGVLVPVQGPESCDVQPIRGERARRDVGYADGIGAHPEAGGQGSRGGVGHRERIFALDGVRSQHHSALHVDPLQLQP